MEEMYSIRYGERAQIFHDLSGHATLLTFTCLHVFTNLEPL